MDRIRPYCFVEVHPVALSESGVKDEVGSNPISTSRERVKQLNHQSTNRI